MKQNRLEILKKVENGEISLDVASKLLADIEQSAETIENVIPPIIDNDDPVVPDREKIKKPARSQVFWLIPLLLGVLLTVFSATWLYQNYESSG